MKPSFNHSLSFYSWNFVTLRYLSTIEVAIAFQSKISNTFPKLNFASEIITSIVGKHFITLFSVIENILIEFAWSGQVFVTSLG